jgi:hypothetical protein
VWRASLLSSVSAIGNPTGELLGALWLLLGATIGNPSRVLLGATWLLLRAVARMSLSLLRGFSVNALPGPAGIAEVERADEGAGVWRASLLSSVSAIGNPTGELLGAVAAAGSNYWKSVESAAGSCVAAAESSGED